MTPDLFRDQKLSIDQSLLMEEEPSSENIAPFARSICLNPFCKENESRIMEFDQEKSMNTCHAKCSGWSLNLKEDQSLWKPSGKRRNVLNYSEKPVKSLMRMFEGYFQKGNQNSENPSLLQGIKKLEDQTPIETVKIAFEQIHASIENQLLLSFKEIEGKIKGIEKIHREAIEELKSIRGLSDSEIENKIKSSEALRKYSAFTEQIGSLVVLNDRKALKEVSSINELIKQLETCFWSKEPTSKKRERVSLRRAQEKIPAIGSIEKSPKNGSLIEAPSEQPAHPALQVQKLGNMFSTGTIQPICSSDMNIIELKCWFCSHNMKGEGKNIKERKRSAYERLLGHVHKEHQKLINAKLHETTMKHASFKVTFEEMIEEIENIPYEKYVVVDKENIGKLQIEEIKQKDCFCINVVTKQTQNLARGKYLMTDSTVKDAADTLIVLVVRAISESRFYKHDKSKGKEIVLYTRDHFGNCLRQILSEIGVKITIRR